MALDRQKLYAGLVDAYTQGAEASSEEAAGLIASAIENYARDAEIMLFPGPMLIPGTPPVPSTSQNAMVTVQTADLGTVALKAAILGGFTAEDPALTAWAAGCQVYAAASFISFMGSPPLVHLATGVAVMAVPPVLVPSIAIGLAGGEMKAVADSQATAIHSAFLATIFTGAGVGIDGGLGAVTGPLI